MSKIKDNVNGILVAIITALIVYFIIPERYPIKYKVCSSGYVDCETVAKFKTRDDCETTKQKWGWRCNSFDKNNITCYEPHESDTFATGFCD